MNEFLKPKPENEHQSYVSNSYDEYATQFGNFGYDSFTWRNIEKPAFTGYLEGYFSNDKYRDMLWLDGACGFGRVSNYLIKQGVLPGRVTGLDIPKLNKNVELSG